MRNFTMIVLTLIASIIAITSCRTTIVDAVSSETTVQPGLFTIEDGHVSFKSATDFKAQIHALKQLTPQNLSSWNQKTGVKSLFEVAEDKSASTGARESTSNQVDLSDVINDPYFASLVNSLGEFSIGKKIIRITPEFVFIGDKSLVSQMRQLNSDKYKGVARNKHIIDNGIIVGRSSHLSVANSNGRLAFNGVDHTIYDWDGTHRSATVIYNDNWFVYRSIGTKVKFQIKRWWGGWWEGNTEALHMDYAVTYDVSRLAGFQQYITLNPPPQDCQNCGNITDTIDFDIAETGWGGDGISISLIDSPYDFKSFVTNSAVSSAGRIHYDRLEEDQ